VKASEDYMTVLRNSLKRKRVVNMLYSTGEIMERAEETIFRPQQEHLDTAKKRYPDLGKLTELWKNEVGALPFSKIKYHIETAKHLLEIDGEVIPVAFLYFSDKPPLIVSTIIKRPTDRYLIAKDISNKIAETYCVSLIIVAEFWGGEMPNPGEDYIPASVQRKTEGIHVLAATPGRLDCCTVSILRDESGKPIFDSENYETNCKHTDFPSLRRVYEVWGNAPWAKQV
jgi:hypothetical protein